MRSVPRASTADTEVTPSDSVEDFLRSLHDKPWVTIVWDDPINLMSYVTHVFMTVFGYSRVKAHELMLKVHHDGKAVVSTGTREEMEHDVAMLHEYGLWATLQRME
jgi:ATP-dependent Clp protease adaptor protein ClpS